MAFDYHGQKVLRSEVAVSLAVGLSLGSLLLPIMAAIGGGCSNHDGLAPDPDAATSSHASSSAASTTSSGSDGSGTGGAAPVEPDGPTRLTLVDALTDAPTAAFCFASYPSGAAANPPFPPGGLAFAKSLVVSLPSADIPSSDVLLTIITGDLSTIAGASCSAIVADPTAHPDLVITSLGVLPAATLSAKRSLLLAPMGCIGSATHVDTNQEMACGKGYTPDTPTITLLAAPLSRLLPPDKVGFQAVNAVPSLLKADVYIRPGFDGYNSASLAPKLALGGVGPFPPYTAYSASGLGSVGAAQIGIAPNPSSTPLPLETLLSDALSRGGLTPASAANGQGLALIACGASPTLGATGWWNPFTFLAVATEPEMNP